MSRIAAARGYDPRTILASSPTGTRLEGVTGEPFKATFLAALGQFSARGLEALGPGDDLLISFTGHGDRRRRTDESFDDSGWVFADDVLFDVDLESALNELALGVRVLVISEACYSGTIVATGPIRDTTRQVIREQSNPMIIQISAAYDYEHAHVYNGIPVFTRCLEMAWDDGTFSGTHEEFADRIGTEMRRHFDASGNGIWWQEPRYLRVGADASKLAEFDRRSPFSIGGSGSPDN